MLLESNKLLLVPRRSLVAVYSSLLPACLLAIASVFRPLAETRNTAPTRRTQYPPRSDCSKRTRRPVRPGDLLEIVMMVAKGGAAKKGS